MDNQSFVLGRLKRLYGIDCCGPRTLAMRFECIQHLYDSIAVLGECFLRHLYIHLGTVLLQAQFRMFLKPPGRDLSFADSAEDRKRWRNVTRICRALLGKTSKVVGKDFGADSEGLDKNFWKVNRHLANN
jgi:hypothetical protein